METIVKKLYEAMFLVDSAKAAQWDKVVETISGILERSEAEIVSIRKWDEHKLAYEINKVSRGTYILVVFTVDGSKIGDIERDVQLSEEIMRVLILSAEHNRAEDIEADTPAMRAEKARQKPSQEPAQKEKAEAVREQPVKEPKKEDSEAEQQTAAQANAKVAAEKTEAKSPVSTQEAAQETDESEPPQATSGGETVVE